MGVADNKSYKNTYHFRDNFFTKDETPSLNLDPKINSTIKENPDRSNVEIEGNEIVLKPDLSALFRAVGKKHSKGGMDVQLQPNSFIFSDDKTLAFDKKDHDLFELKKGGNFRPNKNTPAEVLKRNVDPKHYNRLISNISDIDKDNLAKKSSARMLEKYIGTIGSIAYNQERKKNFPDGVPDFSIGTAPVYNTELKEEVMEQKQYAKYGGKVMQAGGTWNQAWIDKMRKEYKDNANVQRQLDVQEAAHRAEVVARPQSNYMQAYHGIGNKTPSTQGEPGPINNYMQAYHGKNVSRVLPNIDIVRKAGPASGVEPESDVPPTDEFVPQRVPIGNPQKYTPPAAPGLKIQVPPSPGNVTGEQGSIDANWEFTPYQRLSQLYNAGKWASAKRYMPMRSHLNVSTVDPNLVNPEQTINDMKSGFNKNLQGIGSLNPILRNAQASEAYGQFLDRAPQVRSQYDNQNAQIQNQFKQYNNQIVNNQRATNDLNDQKYYQESVVGQQNFDNLKSYLGDKWMDNVTRDVETDQTLSYELLSRRNPAYNFDFRSGKFVNNPNRDIRNAQGDPKSDLYTQLAMSISEKFQKGQTPSKEELDFLKALSVGKINFSSAKKGGSFRPRN